MAVPDPGDPRYPAFLAAVVDNASRPLIIVGDDGVISWASLATEDVTGYRPEELVGTNVIEIIHPGDLDRLFATYEHMASNPAGINLPSTFRFQHSGGDYRPFELAARDCRDHPLIAGLVVTLADVSDRIRLDDVLESVASGSPLETTFAGIVRLLDVQLGEQTALVADPGPDGFGLTVTDSVPAGLCGEGPINADPGSRSPWDRAAHLLEPVVVSPLDHLADRWRRPARHAGFASVWIWPVEHPTTGGPAAFITVWTSWPVPPSPGRRLTLHRAARLVRLAIERHSYDAVLVYAARHDPLTGAANRTRLFEVLRRHVADRHPSAAEGASDDAHDTPEVPTGAGDDPAEADPRRTAVLYLDLDGFKAVNDQRGHRVGDLVLQIVTHRIAAQVRPDDLVSRFGGDEFVVLCTDLDGAGEAGLIADRLIESVSRPILVEGEEVKVGASIGIAFVEDFDSGASAPVAVLPATDAIVDAADRALYQVKSTGKGAWRIASPT